LLFGIQLNHINKYFLNYIKQKTVLKYNIGTDEKKNVGNQTQLSSLDGPWGFLRKL